MAVLIAVVGTGTGGYVLLGQDRTERPASSAEPRIETVEVVRTDLSHNQPLPGTLGYASEQQVRGPGEGVVTRLPKEGETVARGKPLLWVDERPVAVFFGDTPLFRKLGKAGVRGRDVTVVRENLEALGYDVGPPSDRSDTEGRGSQRPGSTFTDALGGAIERWQRDLGLPETGTLDVGEVVVVPGPVRVSATTAQVGDEAAGDLLTVTSTEKVVTVPVGVAEAGAIGKGTEVTVVLPDSQEVPGEVTVVGRSLTGSGGEEDGGLAAGPPEVNITVGLAESSELEGIDSAPVEVRFATEVRRDVLAVPVGALVALREGGYAVQLPNQRLVGVRTGMFARGMVEVSGEGITAGMRVVTAS